MFGLFSPLFMEVNDAMATVSTIFLHREIIAVAEKRWGDKNEYWQNNDVHDYNHDVW